MYKYECKYKRMCEHKYVISRRTIRAVVWLGGSVVANVVGRARVDTHQAQWVCAACVTKV